MPKRHNGRRGVTPGEIKQKIAAPSPDVLIGYLSGNNVTQSFHRSLFDLTGYDVGTSRRVASWAQIRTGPLALSESRNDLAKQVLSNGKLQWLFMLDSDMGFAPDTLERMLAVADPEKRPVVGGLCFAMRELGNDGMGGMHTFPAPTIMQWTDVHQDDGEHRFVGVSHYPVNSMIKAGATGAACILIHRSVFERIMEKFGACWFNRVPDPEPGRLMGEDVSFCWRLKELDIPLYIHTGIRTTHMKTVWLGEQDFWMSQVAPPAVERCDVVVPYFGGVQAEANLRMLVNSARATSGLIKVWFVVDETDDAPRYMLEECEVLRSSGTFAQKVNFAYRVIGEFDPAPWFLPVYASARFRPGWLDKAQEVAEKYGVSVVGTNDLYSQRVLTGETSHTTMVRRSYVDELGGSLDGPGTVFSDKYDSDFMHEELVNTARLRNQFQAAAGSHIERTYTEAPQEEDRIRADGVLFQSRLRAELTGGRGNRTPLRVVGLTPTEAEEASEFQQV